MERPPAGGGRIVSLGAGEALALDQAGQTRLRLVAVSAAASGDTVLFLERESGPGERLAVDRPDRLRLGRGRPLRVGGRRLSLLSVTVDSTRGAALELQWVPADGRGARPIFAAGEEPVLLPGSGAELMVMVRGRVPPPGSGGGARLAVTTADTVLAEGTIAVGDTLRVGDRGGIRWLGTRERWVARVRVEEP